MEERDIPVRGLRGILRARVLCTSAVSALLFAAQVGAAAPPAGVPANVGQTATKADASVTQPVGSAAKSVAPAAAQVSKAVPPVQVVPVQAPPVKAPPVNVAPPVQVVPVQAPPVVQQVADTVAPVIQQVGAAAQPVASAAAPVTQMVAPVIQPVESAVPPVTQTAAPVTQPVANAAAPVTPPAAVASPAPLPAAPAADSSAANDSASAAVAAANLPPTVTAARGSAVLSTVGDGVTSVVPVNRAERVAPAIVPAPPPAPINRAERGMPLIAPAPLPAAVTTPAPLGHEVSLTSKAAADLSPVCINAPTGPPCPSADRTGDKPVVAPLTAVAVAGTQLAGPATPQVSAGTNGIAAALTKFRDEVETGASAVVRDVQNTIASLPQTGVARWMRRNPVAVLPLVLASLMMLAGLALRWRGAGRRFGVRTSG